MRRWLPRFTIRGLLGLTLLAAIACAWWLPRDADQPRIMSVDLGGFGPRPAATVNPEADTNASRGELIRITNDEQWSRINFMTTGDPQMQQEVDELHRRLGTRDFVAIPAIRPIPTELT